MRSVPLLMAVWSNAAVRGLASPDELQMRVPLTGMNVPVLGSAAPQSVHQLWQEWTELGAAEVRLYLPRPGRPSALQPAALAREGMRVGAVIAAVGANQALLPRWVRQELVAWDLHPADAVTATRPGAVREAERAFAIALREATEWLAGEVAPAADAVLADLSQRLATGPPPAPSAFPESLLRLLDRTEKVMAIIEAARQAPDPVASATRSARLQALGHVEDAALTLQEAAASGWVA